MVMKYLCNNQWSCNGDQTVNYHECCNYWKWRLSYDFTRRDYAGQPVIICKLTF